MYSKDSFKGDSCAESNLREIIHELDEEEIFNKVVKKNGKTNKKDI